MRFLLLLVLVVSSIFAHKLYIMADDDGKLLHVKSYFTKSSFCQDCKVKILDKNKKVLFEGKTDKKGLATFPFTVKNIDIEVIGSMGHQNEISYARQDEMVTVEQNESYTKLLMSLGIIALIFFILKLIKK